MTAYVVRPPIQNRDLPWPTRRCPAEVECVGACKMAKATTRGLNGGTEITYKLPAPGVCEMAREMAEGVSV